MVTTLAERKTHIQWELAAMQQIKVQDVLESAKTKFPHACTCVLEKRSAPDLFYGEKVYWLVVKGPQNTDPKFVQGIKDMLNAV